MNSDYHNLLSSRFIRDIVGPAIKNGATYAELMVIFETIQTGMLEVLHRHYQVEPSTAVGLLEASLQRAIERFAALKAGGQTL